MTNFFDDYPQSKAIFVDGVAGGGKTTLIAAHAEGCIRAGLPSLLMTHSRAGRDALLVKLTERDIYAKTNDLLEVVTIDALAEKAVSRMGDRRFRLKKEYVEQVILPHILSKAVSQLEGRLEVAPSITPRVMKTLMRDLDVFRSTGAYLMDDPEFMEEAVHSKIDLELTLVSRVFRLYEEARRTWRPDDSTDWVGGLEWRGDAKKTKDLEGFRCEGEAISDMLDHERFMAWQLRENQSTKFKYILIDEFHDTTPLQLIFLEALCRPATKVMAVGDKLQNIYAWRGSDPDVVFNTFKRNMQPVIVPLHQTYRFGKKLANLLGEVANRPDWRSLAGRETKISFSRHHADDLLRQCFEERNFKETVIVCKDEPTLIDMLFDGVDTISDMRTHVSYPLAQCFASNITTFLCSLHLPNVEWRGNSLHDGVREFMSMPQCYYTEDLRLEMLENILGSLKSERGLNTDGSISNNLIQLVQMQVKPPQQDQDYLPRYSKEMLVALRAWLSASAKDPLAPLLESFEKSSGFIAATFNKRNSMASDLMVKSWRALLRYITKHHLTIADWPACLKRLKETHREKNVLKVLTIEQVKGHQYRKVVIYGLNDGEFPSGRDGVLERNRFYVAASRAMEELVFNADKQPGKYYQRSQMFLNGTAS